MNKLKAILLSVIPIIGVLIISVNIYARYPSTIALLFVFFLSLLSLLLAVIVYKRFERKSKEIVKHVETDLPEIENDLIYIDPKNFAEHYSKEQGYLYLAGEKVVATKVKLESITFNKLLDCLEFKFSNQIRIKATGMQNIGIGDQQFCLFFFNELSIKVGSKMRSFSMNKKELYEDLGEKQSHVLFTHSIPPLVFHW